MTFAVRVALHFSDVTNRNKVIHYSVDVGNNRIYQPLIPPIVQRKFSGEGMYLFWKNDIRPSTVFLRSGMYYLEDVREIQS